MPLDVHAQKVEALVDVDDHRLLLGEPKPHWEKHPCCLVPQAFGVGPVPGHEDDEVVRVSHQAIVGQALAAPLLAVMRVPCRRPRLGEMFVQDGQGDVGEQRRKDSSNAMDNWGSERGGLAQGCCVG